MLSPGHWNCPQCGDFKLQPCPSLCREELKTHGHSDFTKTVPTSWFFSFLHLEDQAGRPHPTLHSPVADLKQLSPSRCTHPICANSSPHSVPDQLLILTHVVVRGQPHSTLSRQTLPSSARLPILSLFLSNQKLCCLSSQQFSDLLSENAITQLPRTWQSHPSLVIPCDGLAHVTLESAVSSWKSYWALLGQVHVPVGFLEHSKPQTPIPLTHISKLEDYSTDTRKTASKIVLQSCHELSLLKGLSRSA